MIAAPAQHAANPNEIEDNSLIMRREGLIYPGDLQSLSDVQQLIRAFGARCRASVQGRDGVIALVLTALFADGHILLEDHPGSGKTTLAKALGLSIEREDQDGHVVACRRIQFTPDMLPSDVTGVSMFDPESRTLTYHPGPIFSNVVLADEINRTSPKVQASLLEAMAEKQVTVDNQTHDLEEVFFVIATQNPLDLCGTYPLPKAQLDRFLFKVKMHWLERDCELQVLARRGGKSSVPPFAVSPRTIVAARKIVQNRVQVGTLIHECLVDIAQALRKDRRVSIGISTRSLVLAIPALQVWATCQQRDFVSPQDIKDLAVPLFSHRIDLSPGVKDADEVVQSVVTPIIEAAVRRTLKK